MPSKRDRGRRGNMRWPGREYREMTPTYALYALAVCGLVCCSVQAGELAPHRATYIVSSAGSAPDGTAPDVKGRMEIHVERSCDGWKFDQFFGFRMRSSEGAIEHLAHTSGFELLNGGEYWFSTKTYEDRSLTDEVSGVARIDPVQGDARAKYAKPEPAIQQLPADTIFPALHIQHLLKTAEAGQKSLRRIVFDGTSVEGPYEVSTFIGRGKPAHDAKFGTLENARYWPLRMAYFKLSALEPKPDFQVSIDLFENGVAGDMRYDYDDFALRVALDEVEVLKSPDCD